MSDIATMNLDYDRPVKFAEGVYWTGFYDSPSGLHCNPYLIVDGEEAVIIDSGSRPDFPTVMMKILQTGIPPSAISALIFQHFDPDVCGGVQNFEQIIGREDLRIISQAANGMYIRHFATRSPLLTLEEIGGRFTFASGRTLQFIPTPYAHAAGCFITFDAQSGVLFTADLFGSFSREWELFLKLPSRCRQCSSSSPCPEGLPYCPLQDILDFHRRLMPAEKALRMAVREILKTPHTVVAPQHGSVIPEREDVRLIGERLLELKGVGIDGLAE
jgi:flavorubredoxin